MIGIYKITNSSNGKVYIGKSADIERRWKEHIRHSKDEFTKEKPPIHRAINKYGAEAFIFEVIEECKENELNEKEKFYIQLYDSRNKKKGYNISEGGDGGPVLDDVSNPNSVLDMKTVVHIRECYRDGVYKLDCYNDIKQKIDLNFNTFNSIWFGRSYKKVMPEVFTEENRKFHRDLAFKHRTPKHVNKVKDYVLEIREKKKKGMKYSEVRDLYNFINVNTFNDIWMNRTFKYIYS